MTKKLEHYTASWCGPCQMMAPIIAQYVAEHPELEYEKIDINEQEERARAAGIMGVPTWIATTTDEDGSCTNIETGAMPPSKLDELFTCK